MKKALLTGHTRGFGSEILNVLLKNKWNVVGISRTKPEIVKNLISHQVDLSNLSKLNKLFMEESLLNNNFDLIILNAGILGEIKPSIEVSNEKIIEILNINFLANKTIIDKCLKQSDKKKNFLFVSSGASTKGYSGWLEYCCSKSIGDSMIRVYAREYKQHIFTSISPGALNTEMQNKITNSDLKKLPDLKKFYDLKKNNSLRSPKEAAEKLYELVEKLDYEMSGKFLKI